MSDRLDHKGRFEYALDPQLWKEAGLDIDIYSRKDLLDSALEIVRLYEMEIGKLSEGPTQLLDYINAKRSSEK